MNLTSQITQLKTELREFIKLSETITHGPWETDMHEVNAADGCCISLGSFEEDAAFIARSRNISPTMAKMLLSQVVWMQEHEELDAHLQVMVPSAAAKTQLQQLLKLWEETK